MVIHVTLLLLQQNEILEGFQSNSTSERMDQLYEVDDDDDGDSGDDRDGSGGDDDHDNEDEGDDDVLVSQNENWFSKHHMTN